MTRSTVSNRGTGFSIRGFPNICLCHYCYWDRSIVVINLENSKYLGRYLVPKEKSKGKVKAEPHVMNRDTKLDQWFE